MKVNTGLRLSRLTEMYCEQQVCLLINLHKKGESFVITASFHYPLLAKKSVIEGFLSISCKMF